MQKVLNSTTIRESLNRLCIGNDLYSYIRLPLDYNCIDRKQRRREIHRKHGYFTLSLINLPKCILTYPVLWTTLLQFVTVGQQGTQWTSINIQAHYNNSASVWVKHVCPLNRANLGQKSLSGQVGSTPKSLCPAMSTFTSYCVMALVIYNKLVVVLYYLTVTHTWSKSFMENGWEKCIIQKQKAHVKMGYKFNRG